METLLHAERNCVNGLLEAISSTAHEDDTLSCLIGSISNACGLEGAVGASASQAFAEGGVFSFLQPPLLSSDHSISLAQLLPSQRSRAARSLQSLSRRRSSRRCCLTCCMPCRLAP